LTLGVQWDLQHLYSHAGRRVTEPLVVSCWRLVRVTGGLLSPVNE
jgi:hypothetical protein